MKKKREAIASIIQNRLGFTNGWHVSNERYDQLCKDAALEIIQHLPAPSGASPKCPQCGVDIFAHGEFCDDELIATEERGPAGATYSVPKSSLSPVASAGEPAGLITLNDLWHLLFPEGTHIEFNPPDVSRWLEAYTEEIEKYTEHRLASARATAAPASTAASDPSMFEDDYVAADLRAAAPPATERGVRDLIAKWREGKVRVGTSDMQTHGARWMVTLCADELEATLAAAAQPDKEAGK